MDGKFFVRIGVVVFIAVTVVSTAIGMRSKGDEAEAPATPNRPLASEDPFAAELRRCSRIGEAGPRDPGCLKAWAESRHRFLGQRAPATATAPLAPTTLFPDLAGSTDRKEGERTDVTAPAMRVEPPRPEVR
ncbi:putative entry exclusion protein TrbK-alt [Mesorhizobium sp. NZP2077]|uniref:putative entry exclusion protein TrbK-alt n=1 Tax=Mesorhizobium sp. NZP2077 TaxID=2483404 RepID=UPI001556C084|nr:putative entry exclusion protein TrbK-alt [Mesorhizobium sp. NZP2077]QKC85515.1 hypothetical protein EB232_31725 [Mesorhizobium sp. NZP2077]QKD19152.1 putative entry exclusion protein TrbK-alt [Mesorhizobium sp. NZP2077]